jgi:hypothetical protein
MLKDAAPARPRSRLEFPKGIGLKAALRTLNAYRLFNSSKTSFSRRMA